MSAHFFTRLQLATPLAAALLAACTSIPEAPEGAPRVEVELALEIEDRFVEPLAVEDKQVIAATFHEAVLDDADVGMRFYPVLSELYEDDSQRPPYLLKVVARDLEVQYDFKTEKGAEGEEPRVVTELAGLRCNVTATLERRRQGRPALPVARGQKEVQWSVDDPDAGVDTFPLKPIAEGEGGLSVAQDDVMEGVDRAVTAALRQLVHSVDRELALSEKRAAQGRQE